MLPSRYPSNDFAFAISCSWWVYVDFGQLSSPGLQGLQGVTTSLLSTWSISEEGLQGVTTSLLSTWSISEEGLQGVTTSLLSTWSISEEGLQGVTTSLLS
ncbi:hypothetical protein ZOSMA_410G00090 [Zostera marina]|uniref:Uncharacterized protein n=1 Tax=Zostera marina TaxID=29655 RepID=A0A0K9P595_ZOSMR|nr:hypothetical protein ZOSMA_410G00090 [Zostera marina]